MVGLGPSPAARKVVAPAGAIWLAETSSPATARTTAISMIRIRGRCIPSMMFTEVFLSAGERGVEPVEHDPVGLAERAGMGGTGTSWQPLCHRCRTGRWSWCRCVWGGLPCQHCPPGSGVFASVGSLAATPAAPGSRGDVPGGRAGFTMAGGCREGAPAIFLSTFVMIGQNRQSDFQQAKADHDFTEQELELKTNTELTREIHTLTTEPARS